MTGLNLIPIEKSGRGRGARKPLADIPVETVETIEEAWAYFQTPDALPRLQTPPFASKEDAETFLSDARSYAYQREAGRLVVTGNVAAGSTRGQFVARFDVTAYVESTPDGATGTE